MSFAELQNEITRLSAEELKLLREAVDAEVARKEATAAQVELGQYLGCTRGMMQFHPGWEDDEPLETWEALRDESHL